MQINPGNEVNINPAETVPAEGASVESAPVVEIPEGAQGVVQENVPTQVSQNTQPLNVIDPVSQNSQPIDEEIKEEFSGVVSGQDNNWVGQAKQVMKDYSGKPFDEEEAAEDLNEQYMEKRFGVKIEKGDS